MTAPSAALVARIEAALNYLDSVDPSYSTLAAFVEPRAHIAVADLRALLAALRALGAAT